MQVVLSAEGSFLGHSQKRGIGMLGVSMQRVSMQVYP